MLPTKFLFIWPSGFREDFQKCTNQKQELPVAAMFVNESERNEQSLQRTFHKCFLPSFSSFGIAVLAENLFQISTNQKQELPVVAMFANGSGQNVQSTQRTCQMLPTMFRFIWPSTQRRRFLEIGQSETRIVCGSHVCQWIEPNEQSLQRTFHRCFLSSFGSFGQAISEKIFQKSTNQKQELSVAAIFVNGLGRNEQSLLRTFHRCFLLSFHFIWPRGFRGEDFLEIGQSETRIACGGHVS